MQAVIDRVMMTYGLLTTLSPDEEQSARERVTAFLVSMKGENETRMAVEGLRFLRGDVSIRKGRKLTDVTDVQSV
jgi:hypothetical protein